VSFGDIHMYNTIFLVDFAKIHVCGVDFHMIN